MCPGQIEPRALMHRQCEGRWMPALHRMAVLAPIVVRRRGKLPEMLILVAIGAQRELQFVYSRSSGGDVTLVTRDRRMLSFQGIGRSCVLFYSKSRGFEAIDCVT